MKEIKSKEERNMYFVYLIEVYRNNECNKLDALLEDLDKSTLKYLIMYVIDNLSAFEGMNVHIFVRLVLDCL